MYSIFYLAIFLAFASVVFCIVLLVRVFHILFSGAIYVQTTDERVEKMVKILQATPGQSVVDLGAGDGRLVIALAKTGVKAYGYEIDPFLASLARKNIKKSGLDGNALIYCKNMWLSNLKDYDAVVIYPMVHIMKRLEKKFEKELKPGSKVVSNYFTLPTWKPDRVEDRIYLYIKK